MCACWMDGCGMGGGGIPLKVWGLGQLSVYILLPCGRGLEVIFVLTTNILVSTFFFFLLEEKNLVVICPVSGNRRDFSI